MCKKMLLTAVLGMVLLIHASAQVFNVPDKAKTHFKTNYNNARDVDWRNNVSDYNCFFKEGDIDCRANYHLDGTWNYTEKKIPADSIPVKVSDSFSKSKYRDWALKSVLFVENNKKESLYRYEVKKGVKVMYIFFDTDGKLIKENASI
ncbi:PepSY-like domain-containing protein [Flavihumibacter fluvii]|uniref:PepSY-like domain-containing protein n=1 Tax=Flavihumibacter fluvii TaxID=2838157 RepID=UPI001BDE425C|nr:PepSY-like domain-containing protein [Flavihumibacter fluvii]ULQ52772.1 PepSY-like domain-containing protein [Flavihumibacter fluvii]